MPVALGGKATLENLVTACRECNIGKNGAVASGFRLPRLRCAGCRRDAKYVVFVPWLPMNGLKAELVTTCGKHEELYGYDIPLAELTLNPASWLNHLTDKRDNVHVGLRTWLFDHGLDKPFPIQWHRRRIEAEWLTTPYYKVHYEFAGMHWEMPAQ
jgi:hypothetical protein